MTLTRGAGLREAAGNIAPISDDYPNLPIEDAFDWHANLSDVPFEQLYLVVFRSVRRADADDELLRAQDDLAYAEALEHGGLLRYFKGELNEKRECLSFCLWETREQAVSAASRPSHSAAASISERTYESYVLERYAVLRDPEGDLRFVPLSPPIRAV